MHSNNIAIKVENISKCYRIGLKEELHTSFAGAIFDFIRSPLKNYRKYRSLYKFDVLDVVQDQDQGNNPSDIIWALKDVSFKVNQGEVVGIIGRNGAGKSTLLKILSKITDPTSGSAEIRGRVSSLLEVGTGFHPELTGRENIYLNGTVLGMTKKEVDRKFAEIVDFSGVENFIDTPVKRYSSGMKVRLAFSVAAHLEPEILLVDEVLAVGDAAFQKKCLGKMDTVAKEGRTVLFVSHNMGAVQALCPRAILLQQGHVVLDDKADVVVRKYFCDLVEGAETAFANNPERRGVGGLYFTGGTVLDESNQPTQSLFAGQPASFEFRYANPIGAKQAQVQMTIYNNLGTAVTSCSMNLTNFTFEQLRSEGVIRCHIPNLPFPMGQYRIAIAVSANGRTTDWIPNALVFEVEGSMFYKSGRSLNPSYGVCMVLHEWHHETSKS